MEKILDRVGKFADFKGVSMNAFERSIGASKGVLSRAISQKTDIQSKWLEAIVENYPEISPAWLLAGEGSMLRSDCHLDSDKTGTTQGDCRETVETKKVGISSTPNNGIPLVTTAAAAGFGSADFAIQEKDIEGYYLIPAFQHLHIDFLMHLHGDSMLPRYYSGDIVACTILHDHTFLQWNKPHIIATREQGLLCKRIMPSDRDGCIKAVSENPDYPPFDIPITDITGLAIICGTIRRD